jgi:ribosomal protein S3
MLRSYSEIFKEWKKEAGVRGPILIGAFPNLRDTIKICTDRPGALIGKGGEHYEKYKKKLQELNPKLKEILFIETESYYI